MNAGVLSGVLSGHASSVLCVALSRDNSYVVSGGGRTIIVHSTKTGILEYRADVFAFGVYGLCYLPNGSLVACGYDNNLKVFHDFVLHTDHVGRLHSDTHKAQKCEYLP